MKIKTFVETYWRDAKKIGTILGAKYPHSVQWDFGEPALERAIITVVDGRITRIQTWSGLRRFALGGYYSPTVDVATD